ncbi:25581_t:CDS:2, partial [Gigaspora margarita]
ADRLAKEGALCDTSWILTFKQPKYWCCNLKWKESVIELEAQAISLAWAYLKDETRAVIILRDLCIMRAKKRGAEEMRFSQRANLQEPARKKRKLNNKTELQNSNI